MVVKAKGKRPKEEAKRMMMKLKVDARNCGILFSL